MAPRWSAPFTPEWAARPKRPCGGGLSSWVRLVLGAPGARRPPRLRQEGQGGLRPTTTAASRHREATHGRRGIGHLRRSCLYWAPHRRSRAAEGGQCCDRPTQSKLNATPGGVASPESLHIAIPLEEETRYYGTAPGLINRSVAGHCRSSATPPESENTINVVPAGPGRGRTRTGRTQAGSYCGTCLDSRFRPFGPRHDRPRHQARRTAAERQPRAIRAGTP